MNKNRGKYFTAIKEEIKYFANEIKELVTDPGFLFLSMMIIGSLYFAMPKLNKMSLEDKIKYEQQATKELVEACHIPDSAYFPFPYGPGF